jgi:hypothetical protein
VGDTRPAPFFLIGSERSGSNLLRLVLATHSRLAVPHPPHLVRYFKPIQSRYGDLSRPGPFHALVRDVRHLLDVHIHPWDVPLDWDRIEAEASPRDAFGIHYALYDQYAAARGKVRWGCKSTFMVDEVPTLAAHHPGAVFLWLYRDPRDVAASARRSVFSPSHPVLTAELWRDQQATARRWEREGFRVVRVAYEEMVAEPERVTRAVCVALDEAFEPAMLRFFETEEARRTASLSESWANVGAAVDKGRVGRAREVLSAEEIRQVEAICVAEMAELGYVPSAPVAPLVVSDADRARYRRAAWWMDAGIELRSVRNDKNVWRRWRRAWFLRRLGAPR